ncbi:hypothetical protein BGZ73_001512, partial [Actinomortierella ambigua]
WEHIGWMIVYILAIPVFSFYLPIYSFWHFDDFSWGNTRVVVGDKGRKIAVSADEGQKFDPKTIPQRKWSDYEQELWEVQTAGSMESKARYAAGGGAGGAMGMPRPAGGSVYGGGSRTGSIYGSEGLYAAAMGTGSRPQSPAMGMHAPIPLTSMHLQQQQAVAASPLIHQLHHPLHQVSPSPAMGYQQLPMATLGSPQMLHAATSGIAASPGLVASTAVFPAGASPMINHIASFPPGTGVPANTAGVIGTPQMTPMAMRAYTPPSMVGQAVSSNPRASWTGGSVSVVPGAAGVPMNAAGGGGLAPASGAAAGSRLSYQALQQQQQQQQPQNRF